MSTLSASQMRSSTKWFLENQTLPSSPQSRTGKYLLTDSHIFHTFCKTVFKLKILKVGYLMFFFATLSPLWSHPFNNPDKLTNIMSPIQLYFNYSGLGKIEGLACIIL